MWKTAILAALPMWAAAVQAADLKGAWDLDSTFDGYWQSFSPLDASSLTPASDYSFGSIDGFTFLQTQPFISPAKRLVAANPSGPNGGPGATRTNRWTVVMDVRFDAFQPYAGILQLDPTNAGDVTFYLYSTDNITGTLVGTGAIGVFSRDTWYRLALTCGNDGVGGSLSVKTYLNGSPIGIARTCPFDGVFAMRPDFLLFSDDTLGGGDLKPAKLGSIALWGEELGAADIAALGGPNPSGILPRGLINPTSPPLTQSTIAAAAPYAYAANFGWIHCRPSADWGLVTGGYCCSGFAHSANSGWINFGDASPANGIRYRNNDGADSGVNHDGSGNLSGLAWSANVGWINFGTDSIGSPRPPSDPARPRLDLTTGQFSGYAYAANTGWINLATLRTATLAAPDTDGDGLADAWEREKFTYLAVSNGTADHDRDGRSDQEEYLAGSAPNDPSSSLRIVSQQVDFHPLDGYNSWNLVHTSFPGRIYQVQVSDTLAPSSWTAATAFSPGVVGNMIRDFDFQPEPKQFLRVAASLPLSP